jgi:hypothetical protein
MTNKRKIVNYEESKQGKKGKRGSETVEKKEKKFRETASESTNPS